MWGGASLKGCLMENRLLLTAKELAELLGVNKATIWGWRNSGRIPTPLKLGRCTRWRSDEIEAWIKADCPSREKWLQIKS